MLKHYKVMSQDLGIFLFIFNIQDKRTRTYRYDFCHYLPHRFYAEYIMTYDVLPLVLSVCPSVFHAVSLLSVLCTC